jgi:hypothetical protein
MDISSVNFKKEKSDSSSLRSQTKTKSQDIKKKRSDGSDEPSNADENTGSEKFNSIKRKVEKDSSNEIIKQNDNTRMTS